MNSYFIPLLMLLVFAVLFQVWTWSIQRQVKRHHHYREEKRISSQNIIAVHRPHNPHTPAGGLPASQ